MASVGAIYLWRQLTSRAAIELYALGISLIAIASVVSVPHILANLLAVGLPHIPEFLFTAVVKTGMVVQITLIVCAVAAAAFGAEMARGTSRERFA